MLPDDDDNAIDALDAIFEDAALADADDKSLTTPQERARLGELRQQMLARLAEKRRSLLPANARPQRARPIRPSILALAADQLLPTVETLCRAKQVQIAFRKLTALSEDDLRRLIETLSDPE